MKDQNQQGEKSNKDIASANKTGQANNPSKGQDSKNKGQGSSSYGQQTGGDYGQTPDARKGDIGGRKEEQEPRKEGRAEWAGTQRRNQEMGHDLDKLTDPDHTKGPQRSDIDPVAGEPNKK